MYLKYSDLTAIFPNSRGIKDFELAFATVAATSEQLQPKGLFIPLWKDSGELQEAIQNGAVASVWEEGRNVPHYTPNHFPVFFTNDLMKGLNKIMEHYLQTLTKQKQSANVTKFLFTDKELLNRNDKTYDIAVMARMLRQLDEIKESMRG